MGNEKRGFFEWIGMFFCLFGAVVTVVLAIGCLAMLHGAYVDSNEPTFIVAPDTTARHKTPPPKS